MFRQQAGSALEEPPQQGAFSVSLELEDLQPRLLGTLDNPQDGAEPCGTGLQLVEVS